MEGFWKNRLTCGAITERVWPHFPPPPMNTRHFLSPGCLLLVILCSLISPFRAGGQEKLAPDAGSRVRVLAAWTAAAHAGKATAMYVHGSSSRAITESVEASHQAAEVLGIELPTPPKKREDKSKNREEAVAYLRDDLAKVFEKNLTQAVEHRIAEIGLRTAVLMISYEPGGESSTKLVEALAEKAETYGLPKELLKEVLEHQAKKAPLLDMVVALEKMQDEVTLLLGGTPPRPPELTEGSKYLLNAITSMGKAPGYRAKGTLEYLNGDKMVLIAGLTEGKMDLTTIGGEKSKDRTHRIATLEKSIISIDGDRTWMIDKDKAALAAISNALTSAVDPAVGVPTQVDFEIMGITKLGDEEVLHVKGALRDAKPPAPIFEYWIAKDAKLTTVVRRSKIPVDFNGVSVTADLVYSEVGSAMDIRIPEGAP